MPISNEYCTVTGLLLCPQATFAFNTGPLTWSILAFRNSLVFHDLDKVGKVWCPVTACTA